MKIVQFKNGKYGIRKWSWFWVGYAFLDLKTNRHWWTFKHQWIKDCHGTLEQVTEYYALFNDKGTPIEIPNDNVDYKALYHELIYAVERKFPNESRHETALRYIKEKESGACAKATAKKIED